MLMCEIAICTVPVRLTSHDRRSAADGVRAAGTASCTGDLPSVGTHGQCLPTRVPAASHVRQPASKETKWVGLPATPAACQASLWCGGRSGHAPLIAGWRRATNGQPRPRGPPSKRAHEGVSRYSSPHPLRVRAAEDDATAQSRELLGQYDRASIHTSDVLAPTRSHRTRATFVAGPREGEIRDQGSATDSTHIHASRCVASACKGHVNLLCSVPYVRSISIRYPVLHTH